MQYEELQEMVETVAKIMTAVSIWEILACFALGKAIHAMWGLVNTMQFLVYISMWQVTLSSRPRVTLSGLKMVIFGEFLDDLDLANRLASWFGLPS